MFTAIFMILLGVLVGLGIWKVVELIQGFKKSNYIVHLHYTEIDEYDEMIDMEWYELIKYKKDVNPEQIRFIAEKIWLDDVAWDSEDAQIRVSSVVEMDGILAVR